MQNIGTPLIFLFVLVVLIAVVGLIAAQGKASPKYRAKPLMTPTELAFYRLLREAALPLNVAPQVAMGAIVNTVAGLDAKERTGARNKFDRKMIDFVLFEDGGAVKLLVELDDRTHKAEKDAERDRITDSAGYTTLRMRGADARNVDAIRTAIVAKLAAANLPPAGTTKVAPPGRRRQSGHAAAE
ncbi:DUF2726 domain-containing protein [Sandarakinorhabdus sp. DWP1-3-1]|uniref:DUF2726 domain-containing protein n=1 Tax=Sandarakinorhabdus sp. DWP1-3-1 TaxID=2804627 RepID=UPI003CEA314D